MKELRDTKTILMDEGMTGTEADEFIAGMKRGMEARARGKRIPWGRGQGEARPSLTAEQRSLLWRSGVRVGWSERGGSERE